MIRKFYGWLVFPMKKISFSRDFSQAFIFESLSEIQKFMVQYSLNDTSLVIQRYKATLILDPEFNK